MQMPGTVPRIQTEDLTVWYEGEQTPALRQVNLTIDPGERVLLLGPSGSGKSTLALSLNGVIPWAVSGRVEGRILLAGRPISELAPGELRRRVGVLFQDPETQFCMLTVEDEVAFGLENLALPPVEMPARIRAALQVVDLSGLEATRTNDLSGGMQQRLALACLLAMDPEILVLDEPTSNLDPAGTRALFAVLRDLVADRRRTLILIEHKLDHCIGLVDRVVVLDPRGGVVAEGSPRTIFAQYADRLERLGVWQPAASRLAHRLKAKGVEIKPHPVTVTEAIGALTNAGIAPEVVLREEPLAPPPPLMPGPPALSIGGLSFSYGSHQVLTDIQLCIPPGHLVALLGPNGAGKTTLMQLAAGLRLPPADSVRLFGRDVRDYKSGELAATVGYVFQNPEHQFVRQTVFDEVAFGLQLLGCPAGTLRDRVDELLADFGLLDRRWANPFSLSQGEKRRLSVATQMVAGQQLLILDEPTFGQDQATAAALMDRVVGLQRQGKTIVMATHDMQLVATRASMVVTLVGGRVYYAGAPAGLMTQPDLIAAAALEIPPLWTIAQSLQEGVSLSITVPITR